MQKRIRNEIYQYLHSKGFKLTDEDRDFLKTKILEHSKLQDPETLRIVNSHSLVKQKVALYLEKSRTFFKSPRVEGQIEALEYVNKWLKVK